jgi:hypothetical protein
VRRAAKSNPRAKRRAKNEQVAKQQKIASLRTAPSKGNKTRGTTGPRAAHRPAKLGVDEEGSAGDEDATTAVQAATSVGEFSDGDVEPLRPAGVTVGAAHAEIAAKAAPPLRADTAGTTALLAQLLDEAAETQAADLVASRTHRALAPAHAAAFGAPIDFRHPPTVVGAVTLSAAMRGRSSYLERLAQDVLSAVRALPRSPLHVDALRESIRTMTAFDMANHYLVEAVARPSPVNPAIRLVPEPCSMGAQCYAADCFLPQLHRADPCVPLTPVPLIAARSEADMREWYNTGTMPRASAPQFCIVCLHYITYLVITSLENLPGGSTRALPLCCQFISSDSTRASGFIEAAILRPASTNPVQPMPMAFFRQDMAMRRTLANRVSNPLSLAAMDRGDCDDDGDGHQPAPSALEHVPFVDISDMMQEGERFCNSSVWSSDLNQTPEPDATPERIASVRRLVAEATDRHLSAKNAQRTPACK